MKQTLRPSIVITGGPAAVDQLVVDQLVVDQLVVDQLVVDQRVLDQWPIIGNKNPFWHHPGWLSLGSGATRDLNDPHGRISTDQGQRNPWP